MPRATERWSGSRSIPGSILCGESRDSGISWRVCGSIPEPESVSRAAGDASGPFGPRVAQQFARKVGAASYHVRDRVGVVMIVRPIAPKEAPQALDALRHGSDGLETHRDTVVGEGELHGWLSG